MESANVAIVFGPTVMRMQVEDMSSVFNLGYQNRIVELIVVNYDYIFSP